MATLIRRNAAKPRTLPFSPSKQNRQLHPLQSQASLKRPRSPADSSQQTSKRARPAPADKQQQEKDRDARRKERDEKEREWKRKYLDIIPTWTFYFDEDSIPDKASLRRLKEAVLKLGAEVATFYEKGLTHVISNCPSNTSDSAKENNVISPNKIPRGNNTGQDLIAKAHKFDQKVYSTTKLLSVLERCGALNASSTSTAKPSTQSPSKKAQPSLSKLLETERLTGTTERDPTQKRHDYRYFSKNAHWVLVEDMKGELASIVFHEYPAFRSKDPDEKPPWPRLFCHPKARHPFQPYDAKEQRRYEKTLKTEKELAQDRDTQRARFLRAQEKRRLQAQFTGYGGTDLRRSVSMSNLSRKFAEQESVLDEESANASGYLASGQNYVAASGNSVGITSTTGNTSNLGLGRSSSRAPAVPALRGRLEVTTSRRPAGADSAMGPPLTVPNRNPLLRKSKSVNSVRLPKRMEEQKPSYCESCRARFGDWDEHINSTRHRSFAADDSNFVGLDAVLSRVQRRTKAEVEEEERKRHLSNMQLLATPPDVVMPGACYMSL